MRPAKDAGDDFDLFRHRLSNMIDLHHPLARLAGLIDWARFDEAFGDLYTEDTGRPGLPTRLMAGLHLVKHIKGLSDEEDRKVTAPRGSRAAQAKGQGGYCGCPASSVVRV